MRTKIPAKPRPSNKCPWCQSRKILGPRRVRFDEERWCNCYSCGHAWQVPDKEAEEL